MGLVYGLVLALSVNSPALTLSKNSGVFLAKIGSKSAQIRRGRTWAIAVRKGSYKSLFLLNSGRFSLEK